MSVDTVHCCAQVFICISEAAAGWPEPAPETSPARMTAISTLAHNLSPVGLRLCCSPRGPSQPWGNECTMGIDKSVTARHSKLTPYVRAASRCSPSPACNCRASNLLLRYSVQRSRYAAVTQQVQPYTACCINWSSCQICIDMHIYMHYGLCINSESSLNLQVCNKNSFSHGISVQVACTWPHGMLCNSVILACIHDLLEQMTFLTAGG